MDWEKLDWEALDRLRQGFLDGSAARGPYWTKPGDLAAYDATYGERIGWKWDAVLAELKARGWSPSGQSAEPRPVLLDWGCGSGIAGRRMLRAFGSESVHSLQVWDHSPLARSFAQAAARAEFPGLEVTDRVDSTRPRVLVLSHVLNELSPSARTSLREIMDQSDVVVWVEPGTSAVSRDLIAWRESLREGFRVVAPCTHSATCGLLAPANARHWCHGFAPPPPGIYADSDWVKFGQRAGIDLRSLPYSFLVLDRRSPACSPPPTPPATSRIIGDAEVFKGFARILNCDEAGVTELTLQKRVDPTLLKALKRDPGIPIYRWRREGGQIVGAERVCAAGSEVQGGS